MEMFDAHLQNLCFTGKRDLHLARLFELEDEIAKQIAMALHRPLGAAMVQRSPRYSKDPTAYADFMRGYKLSSLGNPSMLDEAARHLNNAVARDPVFASFDASACDGVRVAVQLLKPEQFHFSNGR
jgi:hypothetical protein